MKRPNAEVAFFLAVLSGLLWWTGVEALSVAENERAEALPDLKPVEPRTAENDVDADVCTSLTGPFCAHTNSMALYASYMTPISVLDLKQDGSEIARRTLKDDEGSSKRQKKCFFQHFTSSWMDAGGDVNDIMNQQVTNVDECEQLCCEHAECQSFTFWRGHTCFLRATSKTPRPNGESFSGIRLV